METFPDIWKTLEDPVFRKAQDKLWICARRAAEKKKHLNSRQKFLFEFGSPSNIHPVLGNDPSSERHGFMLFETEGFVRLTRGKMAQLLFGCMTPARKTTALFSLRDLCPIEFSGREMCALLKFAYTKRHNELMVFYHEQYKHLLREQQCVGLKDIRIHDQRLRQWMNQNIAEVVNGRYKAY